LVTTAALVENAQLQPHHRICSEGGEHRLEVRHLDAPKHGRIVCSDFSEILAFSRNAAYARLVHTHLSPEVLDNYADRFGFNSPLLADVPAELGRFRHASEPLTLARTATGFVGSSLSALGAAYLGFVIARGGVAHRLQLLDADRDSTCDAAAPPTDPVRVLKANTAYRLREMMEKVVAHGTAANAFRDDSGQKLLPNLRIAGKTGTLGREDRTASWFVGFAPSRNPEVVVVVLLDNGPIWHTTAKRVAGTLLHHFFTNKNAAAVASN
jgi:cell division protein FtsI/penicillin-binding protein 2